MLNESNTIKTIFTMFTLPRGCIGLRKSSLWSQVLWTVLWCLNKHCSTTTLRLGRGTWAFDWVFRHIRPFSFFYTMVNTASIRSSPREDPPIRVDVVARWLSCALQRDSTHGFLQTLPLDRHRVTAGRETYPEVHFDEFDVEKSVAWRSYSWLCFHFEPVFRARV